MSAYGDEKKEAYLFECDCGDHCMDGVVFYQITFLEPTSRNDFLEMMEKAKQDESPYSVLYDEEFQSTYHIKEFKRLQVDYQDTIYQDE